MVNPSSGTCPVGKGHFWPFGVTLLLLAPDSQRIWQATTHPNEPRWRRRVTLEQRVPTGAWCPRHPRGPQAANTRCRETGAQVQAAIHHGNTLPEPWG